MTGNNCFSFRVCFHFKTVGNTIFNIKPEVKLNSQYINRSVHTTTMKNQNNLIDYHHTYASYHLLLMMQFIYFYLSYFSSHTFYLRFSTYIKFILISAIIMHHQSQSNLIIYLHHKYPSDKALISSKHAITTSLITCTYIWPSQYLRYKPPPIPAMPCGRPH